MLKKQGKLQHERLVQDLKDARRTEKCLRESLIQNPSAALAYEPQIRDLMTRVMQLEDDILRLQFNEEKISDRDRSLVLFCCHEGEDR